MKKTIISFCALAVGLAGCGSFSEEFNDAERIGNNDSGAITISFPDGFSNVAAKCAGPILVFSTMNSNGRAITAIDAGDEGKPCSDGILTVGELGDS